MLLVCCLLAPISVQAYSYGDPNEEPLAEAYKKMAAELNGASPNFAGAKGAFDPMKQELDMHMGPEPAQTVLTHLEEKDKQAVLSDMHKILVLNIARRMASIAADFENYSQNKTLIAKANATYEALSPTVKQTDAALDEKIRKEFNNALTSLGNPGLFGVGIKEADKDLFESSRGTILNSLQDRFKLASLEVGHFTDSDSPGGQAEQRDGNRTTDLSDPRNWIPLVIIVLALVGVVAYTMRKRKRA
ncbi:extracellular protein [Cohnella kolymensis]|uniref:Extracellular protein n=1 Tax=Cohnella kolymensis TaxID=1590652 RepID=A0ABR5A9K2_9BACL|nr:hypothetical protein [Cohnella kolymensis]KIL37741.1 extracellular protein [Cohnella kolymensis]